MRNRSALAIIPVSLSTTLWFALFLLPMPAAEHVSRARTCSFFFHEISCTPFLCGSPNFFYYNNSKTIFLMFKIWIFEFSAPFVYGILIYRDSLPCNHPPRLSFLWPTCATHARLFTEKVFLNLDKGSPPPIITISSRTFNMSIYNKWASVLVRPLLWEHVDISFAFACIVNHRIALIIYLYNYWDRNLVENYYRAARFWKIAKKTNLSLGSFLTFFFFSLECRAFEFSRLQKSIKENYYHRGANLCKPCVTRVNFVCSYQPSFSKGLLHPKARAWMRKKLERMRTRPLQKPTVCRCRVRIKESPRFTADLDKLRSRTRTKILEIRARNRTYTKGGLYTLISIVRRGAKTTAASRRAGCYLLLRSVLFRPSTKQ